MRFFTKPLNTFVSHDAFSAASPFPHDVIDGLLDDEALRSLASNFPDVQDLSWWQYDNQLEKKFAFNDLAQLHQDFRDFFAEANSPEVVAQLAKLAGLPDLVPDHGLRGGGLHQIIRGGKLDVHEDFNINVDMKAKRKLNMIVYLNEDWDESYGGHLQLWNNDMTVCEKSVLPTFNRVVIFRTDMDSNHGHPDPLTCPPDRARRSLATYYYVPMNDEELADVRSTSYKKRPTDPEDPSLDELRKLRVRGRISK